MDNAPRLFDWDQIDQSAYCRLQQQAFAAIFARHAIPIERLDAAFFAWKYASPAGKGRIAVVFHGDEMVASNAMFALTVVTGSKRERAWQSCDTGTTPAARGKGYFKANIGALRDSIASGERFFGYPNAHSRRGCEGIGWSLTSEIPVRMRPVWRDPRVGPEIATVREFGPSQDAFAKSLASREPTMIERSAAYLNWRYVRNPLFDYECFQCTHDGAVTGLLVTNNATVGKRKVLVVMEMLAVDERATKPMLAAAVHAAKSGGSSMLVAIGNRKIPTTIRVPNLLLPKSQVLMGQRVGPPHAPMNEPWLVQAGDWDVF
jgi:hypothetical protein